MECEHGDSERRLCMDIMKHFANLNNRYPVQVITTIIVITVIMGYIGQPANQKKYESEDAFLPDSELARTTTEVRDDYGAGITYGQVLVRAKGSSDVLNRAAMLEILMLEKAIMTDPTVTKVLFTPQMPSMSLMSVADAVADGALTQQGTPLEAITPDMRIQVIQGMNDTQVKGTLAHILQVPGYGEKIKTFISKDIENNPGLPSAKATMILIMYNATWKDKINMEKGINPILDANNEISDSINKINPTATKMSLIEEQTISENVNKVSENNFKYLFPMMIVLILAILLLTYRSVMDTLISLLGLIFAIEWVNGFGVMAGYSFSMLYRAVPILLMGLGIDYGIHIIMRYREELKWGKSIENAMYITLISVGSALVLATITTSISFFSDLTSAVKPMQEFGVFAGMGIIFSFIIMTTFVPSCRILLDRRNEKKGKPLLPGEKVNRNSGFKNRTNDSTNKNSGSVNGTNGLNGGSVVKTGSSSGTGTAVKKESIEEKERETETGIKSLDRFLGSGAGLAEHHPVPTLLIVGIITLAAGYGAANLGTEFSFKDFLPPDMDIVKDFNYVEDNFNISTEYSYILLKGNVTTPEVMKAMDKTLKNMEDDQYTAKKQGRADVQSILTLMQDFATNNSNIPGDNYNATFAYLFHSSDRDADGVPDANITILCGWLMQNDPMDTVAVLHYNKETKAFDGTVIRVKVNSEQNSKGKEITKELNDDAKPVIDLKKSGKLNQAIVTGGPVLTYAIIESIKETGISSMVLTVIASLILLFIIFFATERSYLLGIITTIPVLLVIAWILGTMYLFGMSLNMMTTFVSAMSMGMGITYAIHITHRFTEDLKVFDDIDEAARNTVVHTGTPIFGAAITTIMGFGILTVSGNFYFFEILPSPPIRQFGGIISLTILYSLLSAIFVLPTLLVLWAKAVKKQNPDAFKEEKKVKPVEKEDEKAPEKAVDEKERENVEAGAGEQKKEIEAGKEGSASEEKRQPADEGESAETEKSGEREKTERNVRESPGKDGRKEPARETVGAVKADSAEDRKDVTANNMEKKEAPRDYSKQEVKESPESNEEEDDMEELPDEE